jgi:hypothetical protein
LVNYRTAFTSNFFHPFTCFSPNSSQVLARGTNCEVLLLTGYISAQQLLRDDVLASKVAELALASAVHPEQRAPVAWYGDVAAAANAISVSMTAAAAAVSWVKKEGEEAGCLAELSDVFFEVFFLDGKTTNTIG